MWISLNLSGGICHCTNIQLINVWHSCICSTGRILLQYQGFWWWITFTPVHQYIIDSVSFRFVQITVFCVI